MTLTRCATLIAVSIVSNSITAAGNLPLTDQARDPGVKRWIWYQILGPRDHPFPIVYLSTERFGLTPVESLILLPEAKYRLVAAYTRARIASPECPGKTPPPDVWYVIEIAQHDDDQTLHCILPKAEACNYLSGVMSLRGMNWSVATSQPISELLWEARCKAR